VSEPGDLTHAAKAIRRRELERAPKRIDPAHELGIHEPDASIARRDRDIRRVDGIGTADARLMSSYRHI
jgi:hypothetical protein